MRALEASRPKYDRRKGGMGVVYQYRDTKLQRSVAVKMIYQGTVKRFQFNNGKNIKYPVPQIGWNRVRQNNSSWENTLLRNNQSYDFMYFVHSYYAEPEDDKVVIATTTYGDQEYCSAIQSNNIFATQFHPEKSSATGMKIYEELKFFLGNN